MRRTSDDSRQGGFTILEVLIASTFTAALLGMISTTVISVSSVSRDNIGALRQESRRRDVLSVLRGELQGTTFAGNELIIAPDGKSVRFTILLGATQIAGEVSGVWSSPIEFALEGDRLLRRQDGITVGLARGIQDLTFRRPPGEPFIEVTCVTSFRGEDTARSIRVYPKN